MGQINWVGCIAAVTLGVVLARGADEPASSSDELRPKTVFLQKIQPPPPASPRPAETNATTEKSAIKVPGLPADISPEKRIEIERLMRVTHMEKNMEKMKIVALQRTRLAHPETSEEVWKKFFEKLDTRDLVEQMLPIYATHFSVEELRTINDFYESPAGQKLALSTPLMMEEFRRAGERWAIHVAKEALSELDQLTPTGR